MKRKCLVVTFAILLLTAASCIGIQDGGDAAGGTPTLGRELIDLKKAKDAGAIGYEEYTQLKAKLIGHYE